MKFYDSALAPNPRRVRIFMAEKGVTCENVQVDILQGENLLPEFLAVNPRGLLPTLILDDGTVIDETVAICRYFEETHPEPALMGSDAVGRARIEARQRHMEFDGLMAVADVFRNSFPGFSERAVAGNAGTVAAIPALVDRGSATVARFYQRLDSELENVDFVAGGSFSIADITALCTIDFAVAAGLSIPDDCQRVKLWHERVSKRPSAAA